MYIENRIFQRMPHLNEIYFTVHRNWMFELHRNISYWMLKLCVFEITHDFFIVTSAALLKQQLHYTSNITELYNYTGATLPDTRTFPQQEYLH